MELIPLPTADDQPEQEDLQSNEWTGREAAGKTLNKDKDTGDLVTTFESIQNKPAML